jgi:succinate dehydrogenase / fumarate reductase cytochrome b subunit
VERVANTRAAGRPASFYRTAVGKKAVMAVTGIVLFGFVLGHMLGNLKIFMGAESFNHYAEWLRQIAYPALPHSGFLWIFRLALLASVALHITAATQLTLMNRRARPERYRRKDTVQAGYAERTMRWSGVLIAFYVLYHLLHLTVGGAHRDFIATDPYHNVVTAFQVWPVAAIYIVANLLLGMHLYHGLWSLFQSLGWNHPRYNPWRRAFAVVFAIAVAAGFVAVPAGVLAGLVA